MHFVVVGSSRAQDLSDTLYKKIHYNITLEQTCSDKMIHLFMLTENG